MDEAGKKQMIGESGCCGRAFVGRGKSGRKTSGSAVVAMDYGAGSTFKVGVFGREYGGPLEPRPMTRSVAKNQWNIVLRQHHCEKEVWDCHTCTEAFFKEREDGRPCSPSYDPMTPTWFVERNYSIWGKQLGAEEMEEEDDDDRSADLPANFKN